MSFFDDPANLQGFAAKLGSEITGSVLPALDAVLARQAQTLTEWATARETALLQSAKDREEQLLTAAKEREDELLATLRLLLDRLNGARVETTVTLGK